MLNKIDHLTPQRRVTLAWGLMFVALCCQFVSELFLVNTFVILVAAAFHEILIPGRELKWGTGVIKALCWGVFPALYFLSVFRVLRFNTVIYVLYAFIGLFVIWAVITDVIWLRSQEKSGDHSSQEPG
jgi:hypothetical protein